jgi:hypothetical protein
VCLEHRSPEKKSSTIPSFRRNIGNFIGIEPIIFSRPQVKVETSRLKPIEEEQEIVRFTMKTTAYAKVKKSFIISIFNPKH